MPECRLCRRVVAVSIIPGVFGHGDDKTVPSQVRGKVAIRRVGSTGSSASRNQGNAPVKTGASSATLSVYGPSRSGRSGAALGYSVTTGKVSRV